MTSSGIEFRHHQVDVGDSSLHVAETGDPAAPPFLFLHGWPQSWRAWEQVMAMAGRNVRAIAIDLPGIGQSTGDATDGSKVQMAAKVHGVVRALKLKGVTLVGQDIGAMVAFAYIRAYGDVARAVIVDAAMPGVDPWEEVLANPYIWHFAFHSIPKLPEDLITNREREYFDYFYDMVSANPDKITTEARADYVRAYTRDGSLSTGFSWYRSLQQDAKDNAKKARQAPISTPVLYLRGEHEGGDLGSYSKGLQSAGCDSVGTGVVAGAGHFTQEEAPEEIWKMIADFAGVDA